MLWQLMCTLHVEVNVCNIRQMVTVHYETNNAAIAQVTGPQVHSHHTTHTSNTYTTQGTPAMTSTPCREPALIVGYCGGGRFKFLLRQGNIVLLEESPDTSVGCHFAPSSKHPFVYQRCRHRCRSVRTEEETELVLLSIKLRTCVIGPCKDPSLPWCTYLDTGSGQCPESHYHFRNSVEMLTEFVSLRN